MLLTLSWSSTVALPVPSGPVVQVRCCLIDDLERRGPLAPAFVDPTTGERGALLDLDGLTGGEHDGGSLALRRARAV
jgi:hypothetical protein